jgi:ParB family chromosome partitioning protein
MTPGFIEDIYISQIRQSRNIRKEISNIEELAISIQQCGLLQPIIVRSKNSYFEIVTGHRRFLACKTLGWRKIPCHIAELDDKTSFEISLVENIQRKTLSPLDEGLAFKEYISEFGWGGISDLARRIGKSISYVAKRIKLLDLPTDVMESIMNHNLCSSIADELVLIKDKSEQSRLAALIINRKISLRRSRDIIKTKDIDLESEENFQGIHSKHAMLRERSLDRSISAVRIAMNRISGIINDVQGDWVIYELLMQHKNMLHSQIDILIKEKKKVATVPPLHTLYESD